MYSMTCSRPGGDGKAVAVGIVAVKSVKDHSFIGVLGIKITLHHGQFIEIRQQCQGCVYS